jgi:hypothetical protein
LVIFAQGVQRDQAFRCLDRLGIAAHAFELRDASVENVRRHGFQARPFGLDPLVEWFDLEVEVGQERTAIKRGRALQGGQRGRMGQGREREGIDGHVLRSQADVIAVDDKQVRPQLRTDREQALAQALARMPIGSIGPQQGGEMVAAHPASLLHGAIRDEPAALLGGDAQGSRRCAAFADREPTEQIDRYGLGFRHGASVMADTPASTRIDAGRTPPPRRPAPVAAAEL